ncbi:MAG TPA: hypothetical protein VLF91_04925 [Candidatus Saccharimonadales bacterium]|nr:hypothetical protein [Candidatus Saccharimonadales bacterium]
MSDFIVLGLIPGTQVEMTFTLWLLSTSVLLALLGSWVLWRSIGFRLSVQALLLQAAMRRRSLA